MNLFKKYKTIEDLLPGFLMTKEVSCSNKVYGTYMCHIRVLTDYLKSIGMDGKPMRKITQEQIRDFFIYIWRERHLDRSTCEKYSIHLKLFFAYAKKLGEIDEIPFDMLILPRQEKDHSAEVIRPEDLKILIPELIKADPQLYLASMIQFYCFLRPGKELRLLKIGDIDLVSGIITVRQENAKNGHQQSVTIPRQLIYICYEFGIDKADKELYVFGNKKKFGTKPNSINMLRYRFNKVRERLNLPKGYKFYSFKHSGASMLHRSGVSAREMMDQLRHTNLSSSQHYLHKHCGVVNEKIRDLFPSPV